MCDFNVKYTDLKLNQIVEANADQFIKLKIESDTVPMTWKALRYGGDDHLNTKLPVQHFNPKC